jgi:hypothetical protein
MDESNLFEPDIDGSPPKRAAWLVSVGLITLVLVASAVIFLRPLVPAEQVTPDVQRLTAAYGSHRADYLALARLSFGDRQVVIDLKRHAVSASGVDSETIATAKQIMRRVGAHRLDAHDGQLEIETGSAGLAVSGQECGYLHTAVRPSETVSASVAGSQDAPDLWYCPLGDDWYATVYSF